MKTNSFKIILTLYLLVGVIIGLHAQSEIPAVTRILEKFEKEDQFSGVVLLADKGKILIDQAVGLADRAESIPMKTSTKFRIASITKSFTALLIMQLYEEGKLQLDQSIAELLPELPLKEYHKVKVKHLLNHTSGLPKESDLFYVQKLSPEVFIQRLTTEKARKQKPGKNFNYNNVDYLLLGLVIEKLRKAPWKTVVQERILDPLQMDDTGFLRKKQIPEGLARGYLCANSICNTEPAYFIENFYAAGNMYSTAADLLKWDQGLYGEELLSATNKALMYTSDPALGYVAYGSWTFNHPFVAGNPFTVERRGGILGFNSVIMRFPKAEKTLIILSNTDQFNPDTFGDAENIKEQLVQVLFTARPTGEGLSNH